jgi:hypothetical protein
MTGGQAVQMVRAGLKAIYLSGWQVAADANLAGHTYPDQSLYPANSAPALVRRLNNALLRADQVDWAERRRERDWLVPIVADAEAGFGGPLDAYELMRAMIEAGAAGVHFEDQLASEKKCGHLGGKVLVPTSQSCGRCRQRGSRPTSPACRRCCSRARTRSRRRCSSRTSTSATASSRRASARPRASSACAPASTRRSRAASPTRPTPTRSGARPRRPTSTRPLASPRRSTPSSPGSCSLEGEGYTATRHQREVDAGYFDAIVEAISGGESSTLALRGSTEEEQFAASYSASTR